MQVIKDLRGPKGETRLILLLGISMSCWKNESKKKNKIKKIVPVTKTSNHVVVKFEALKLKKKVEFLFDCFY